MGFDVLLLAEVSTYTDCLFRRHKGEVGIRDDISIGRACKLDGFYQDREIPG